MGKILLLETPDFSPRDRDGRNRSAFGVEQRHHPRHSFLSSPEEIVAGLDWAEIDLPQRMWQLPEERAKNDLPHRVALNALAVAELRIPGPKPYGSSADHQVRRNGFGLFESEEDAGWPDARCL